MCAYDMQDNPTSTSADPLLLTSCPGMTLMRRGKDKDVYDLGDMLLMVSTDRLSAAGKSPGQGVKGKGKIVNRLSAYWFRVETRGALPAGSASLQQQPGEEK